MDFTGKVLKTRTKHEYDNHQEVVTLDTFEYDHMDRLKRQHQCIGDDTLQDNCASSLSSNLTISDPIVTGNHTATNTITINGATTIEAGAYIFITDSNNAGNSEMIVENTYDDLGQLEKKEVGNTQGNSLQTVDYAYNVRGWLKTINQDNNTTDNDLFNFSISYNSGSNALYNGNISKTEWSSSNPNNPLGNTVSNKYVYTYDALNRITSAIDNTSNYNLENVTYDKNGNIKTLQRKGYFDTESSFGTLDDLAYTYDAGNKLQKVLDNGNDNLGFKDGIDTTTEYLYDDNGNMIEDKNKGITSITYNHLNLPEIVTINGQQIKYTYDASGVKLRKEVQNKITDYAGNYIYEDTELQFFNHAEGYASPDTSLGWKYIYQYKDHLGNVRLSYTDINQNNNNPIDLGIIEESNYYPFGLKHKGYNNVISSNGNSVAQKWGYTGKELNDELGIQWHDFGARNYDASLGRWINIDPLADLYYPVSPYNYVFNNPINFLDPDGMRVKAVDEESQTYIMNYLNEILGEGHGFSFKKNGTLRFRKKDVAKGKEYSEEQKSIFDGVKEVVMDKGTTIYAKISEDENTNISIDVKISETHTIKYNEDKMDKTSDGKYQAGQFREVSLFGSDPFGVLSVNRKEAKKATSDAGNGERTSPSESAVFIHELLDHGLYFIRTGVGVPPNSKNKRDEVKFQNKALKIKGSKQRTGTDHGVKN